MSGHGHFTWLFSHCGPSEVGSGAPVGAHALLVSYTSSRVRWPS